MGWKRMFSKLLRLTSFKSIVRVAVDERVESWATSLLHWELGVSLAAVIFICLQFVTIYGNISTNLPQLSFLSMLFIAPIFTQFVIRVSSACRWVLCHFSKSFVFKFASESAIVSLAYIHPGIA